MFFPTIWLAETGISGNRLVPANPWQIVYLWNPQCSANRRFAIVCSNDKTRVVFSLLLFVVDNFSLCLNESLSFRSFCVGGNFVSTWCNLKPVSVAWWHLSHFIFFGTHFLLTEGFWNQEAVDRYFQRLSAGLSFLISLTKKKKKHKKNENLSQFGTRHGFHLSICKCLFSSSFWSLFVFRGYSPFPLENWATFNWKLEKNVTKVCGPVHFMAESEVGESRLCRHCHCRHAAPPPPPPLPTHSWPHSTGLTPCLTLYIFTWRTVGGARPLRWRSVLVDIFWFLAILPDVCLKMFDEK